VVVPALGALTASAAAATRFVAPTGSDEAGNNCLSSADPCQTVQWGIEEAEAGDTVSIAAGTYRGEFQVDKELKLVGQGPSTLLEGEPTVQRPVYLRSDVRLENLRIRGGLDGSTAKDAVYIGGTDTQVLFDNVTAEQAPAATEGTNAVYVSSGDALTMKRSTVTGVGTTCLWVSGSATVSESNITVTPGVRGGEAVYAAEGATVDLIGSAIADSGEKGNALVSDDGTVTATDSSFSGVKGITASAGSVAITRDKLMASEAGLLLHEGATVSLRDSLISPVPGGKLPADVLIESEAVPVPAALTIVGSTLYAEGVGRYSAARAVQVNSLVQARIVNSILRAVEPDSTGEAVDIEDWATGATWSVTYSAFTTVSGPDLPTPGSGTNVAAVPIFAGQATGDYHLTDADTDLLDAGDPGQVTPGETDLAGQPRISVGGCNAAPDIGAYELVPAVVHAESCPVPPEQITQKTEPSLKSKNPTAPSRPKITGVRVKKRPEGPTLEFTLSEPAKVTVTVARATTRGIGKRSKTSYQAVGTIIEQTGKGARAIPLATRLRSRKLTPGAYRLTLVATANGLKSAPRAVSLFENVKR
jgi:hypothetical protein